ncbi:MAG: hypothetical protein ABFR95_10650 [Actinomycetota bacterium]
MPVTAKIRGFLGYNDQMPDADLDRAVAPGAHVTLARLVRLDRVHHVFSEGAE